MRRDASRVSVVHRVSVARGESTVLGVSMVIRGIPVMPVALMVSMVRVVQARWVDREPGGRWVHLAPAV